MGARPRPPKPPGNPRSEVKGEVGAARPEDISGGGCPVASAPSVKPQSNIHIDLIAVQFHQIPPRLRFALAHQLGQ